MIKFAALPKSGKSLGAATVCLLVFLVTNGGLFGQSASAGRPPAAGPANPAAGPSSTSSPGSPANIPLDQGLQAQYRSLLQTLDQLIQQGPHEGLVFTTYSTVRTAMSGAKIQFLADGKSSNTNILQSAYFSPNPKGSSWLVADSGLFALQKKNPGLALALIFNAMVFAKDYFDSGQVFVDTFQNPLESYLYSMDALYAQAIFERDYVLPHYPQISEYERFLIEGLQYENLSSVSMFVLGVDQDIVYGLRQLEPDLKSGKLGGADYLAKVTKMVGEIQDKLDKVKALYASGKASGDDATIRERSRYIAVVSGLTMLKYGVSIMNGGLDAYLKPKLPSLSNELSAFNTALDKVAKSTEPLVSGVMNYRKDFLSKMGL